MDPTARLNILLEAVAADLLDSRVPISREFLIQHEVTLDECFSLSELVGHILRGYVLAPPLVQNNLFLAGVTAGGKLTGEDLFDASLRVPLHSRPRKRTQTLLKHLASDFLASRETFSNQFLVRYNVKADECLQLSEYSGYLVRGYIHAAPVIRNTILICGVAGKTIPGELVFTAGLQLDVKRKLDALLASPRPSPSALPGPSSHTSL